MHIEGIVPPIVTPFRADDEELDETSLRTEAEYLLSCGVDGIAVCGSIGEGNSVTTDEAERAYRVVVEATKGSVPVLAGIIVDSTRAGIERGHAARRAGASALMLTPTVYRTASREGLKDYFTTVAKEVGLDIYIYDIDKTRYIPTEEMVEILRLPGIAGIKQSGGDVHKLADLVREVGDETNILTALDDILFATFALGAHGAISALTSLYPSLCVQLWAAVKAGDYAHARSIHETLLGLWRVIQGETDGQRTTQLSERVKDAINQQGRTGGVSRRPYTRLEPAQSERVREAQRAAGLIG